MDVVLLLFSKILKVYYACRMSWRTLDLKVARTPMGPFRSSARKHWSASRLLPSLVDEGDKTNANWRDIK